VEVSLGLFVCVTGVSGAGKEHTRNQILYPERRREPCTTRTFRWAAHTKVEGLKEIDKVIDIDQSPIAALRARPRDLHQALRRDPRVLTPSAEADARLHPRPFSFNVKGGRCEACEGDGGKRGGDALPGDVYVPCEECCRGKRFTGHPAGQVQRPVRGGRAGASRWTRRSSSSRTTRRSGGPWRPWPTWAFGYIALGTVVAPPLRRRSPAGQLSRELRSAPPAVLYILDDPPPACTSTTSRSAGRASIAW